MGLSGLARLLLIDCAPRKHWTVEVIDRAVPDGLLLFDCAPAKRGRFKIIEAAVGGRLQVPHLSSSWTGTVWDSLPLKVYAIDPRFSQAENVCHCLLFSG